MSQICHLNEIVNKNLQFTKLYRQYVQTRINK